MSNELRLAAIALEDRTFVDRIGPHVGIRFREMMSGSVHLGARRPERDSEDQEFAFDLDIRISSLTTFLSASRFDASIAGGTVTWSGKMYRVRPGTLTMFKRVLDVGVHKAVDFVFDFSEGRGDAIAFAGRKVLKDDGDFDTVADLSRVEFGLREGDAAIARGSASVHPTEFLKQLGSLEVTGTTEPAERRAAVQLFLAFMNRELAEVYSNSPLLFRDDRHLDPAEWRALALLAKVILPDRFAKDAPTAEDVVQQLEKFISQTSSQQIGRIRGWLELLGRFEPLAKGALPELKAFARKVLVDRKHRKFRDALEMIHLMIVFPFNAHPKADKLVGYSRPCIHARSQQDFPIVLPSDARNLEHILFDVIIVGSGPAGAVIAARLTHRGKNVLVVEAGPYVPERIIDADEVRWTAKLYKDGALQRANERELVAKQSGSPLVLQGSCVGGGGMVNNAVCFRLPEARRNAWRKLGFPIHPGDLDRAYDAIGNELTIVPVCATTRKLNPAGKLVTNALGEPGIPQPAEPPRPGFNQCLVSIEQPTTTPDTGCEGCGLCNIACGYGRKRNALQVHMRQAMESGLCTLLPDATVVEIVLAASELGEPRRVSHLRVQTTSRTMVCLHGHDIVLAAGAIGSSALLLRSPDVVEHARQNKLPIGKRFTANIGTPVFAFYGSMVESPPGLQIAHYFLPRDDSDGFVLETWFNPPGAQAMAIPGFLDEHFGRMRRYPASACLGVLVRAEPRGVITWSNDRANIELSLGNEELARLKHALRFAGSALLAGGDGKIPQSLLFASRGRGMELSNSDQLDAFIRGLSSPADLRLGTGHPQGGNAMSEDPAIGVVDRNFKVVDIDNLRVCDGSIFPDCAGVNPQWTIMALAHECARTMVDRYAAISAHPR